MSDDNCRCGRLSVGDGRNWNPDCNEHGTDSDWYTSSEQVAKRAARDARLIDLQAQAREARRAAAADRMNAEQETP